VLRATSCDAETISLSSTLRLCVTLKHYFISKGYTDLPKVHNFSAQKLRQTFSCYTLPDDAAYSLQTDLDMIEHLDTMNGKLEWRIEKTARGHDNQALAILKSIQGLGTILSLTMLYEIHSIQRFPTAQKFSSYSRVVQVERSSHGKKLGSKNGKIGNPYLRWAFGQLAVSAQRFYPSIKNYTQRLIKKFGMRKAYSLLAHKFAVTVYYLLKNKTAFDVKRFVAA